MPSENTQIIPPSQPSEVRADRERFHYLDGLKGLVALYIVAHHMYYEDRAGLDAWDFLLYGRFAVAFFIVISGFTLTLDAINNPDRYRGYVSYLKRRAGRLLPPYFAGLLLSILMILLFIGKKEPGHWSTSLPLSIPALFSSVFLVQNFTPYISKINHAYWFMPLIWQLSVIFPFLLFTLRKITVIPFVFLSFLLGRFIFYHQSGTIFSRGQFHFIALFCVGMAVAHICTKGYLKKFLGSLFAQALALLCVAYYFFYIAKVPGVLGSKMFFMDFFTAFTCSVILLVGFASNGFIKRILEFRPLAFVGVISYSLYLTHTLVIAVGKRYVLNPLQLPASTEFLLLLGVGMPIAFTFAWIFYRLVEHKNAIIYKLFSKKD